MTSQKSWPPILARAAEIVAEYDTAVTLRQVHYRLVAEAESAGSGYRNTPSDYKRLSDSGGPFVHSPGEPSPASS